MGADVQVDVLLHVLFVLLRRRKILVINFVKKLFSSMSVISGGKGNDISLSIALNDVMLI